MVMGAIYYFKRKELDKDAVYDDFFGCDHRWNFNIQTFPGERNILFINSYTLSEWYGFGVGLLRGWGWVCHIRKPSLV